MKRTVTLFSLLVLAACAGTGASSRGASSDRSTTTISMPASSNGASVARPIQLTTSADAAAIVTVDMSANRVWEALPAAYQLIGVEVGTVDQENRVIGNRRLRLTRRLGGTPLSRYLRCGDTAFGAPQADHHPVELSMLTKVFPDGEQSRMETSVHAVVINSANGGARMPCSSTGVLERALAEKFTVR